MTILQVTQIQGLTFSLENLILKNRRMGEVKFPHPFYG